MEFGVPKPIEIVGRAAQAPWIIGRGVVGLVKNFSCDREGFAQQAKDTAVERHRVEEQLTEIEPRINANILAEEVLRRAAAGEAMDEQLRSLRRLLGDPSSQVGLDNIWLYPGHADMLRPYVEDVVTQHL